MGCVLRFLPVDELDERSTRRLVTFLERWMDHWGDLTLEQQKTFLQTREFIRMTWIEEEHCFTAISKFKKREDILNEALELQGRGRTSHPAPAPQKIEPHDGLTAQAVRRCFLRVRAG